ncbi:hypothetical protein HYH03_017466 [Edaphochlamys debaryana]|uniref:Uncharacterized protein n=1 Tax=Edaphochlamys debaryana TaxID=47281 RepID=A0A835XGI7_9CHLO|nr:hypothetical protein HYH03_017466 [Edaphochlamys debaryana]|eukprot:KAG2483663.1 hypothetical protein HYH03_017466 [Edaphochlamys debaryana]
MVAAANASVAVAAKAVGELRRAHPESCSTELTIRGLPSGSDDWDWRGLKRWLTLQVTMQRHRRPEHATTAGAAEAATDVWSGGRRRAAHGSRGTWATGPRVLGVTSGGGGERPGGTRKTGGRLRDTGGGGRLPGTPSEATAAAAAAAGG